MYKRGTRRVTSPPSTLRGSTNLQPENFTEFDVKLDRNFDDSLSKRSHIASVLQGVVTCAALFAGALWVIELKPSEAPSIHFLVDACDLIPEPVGIDDRYEDSLTIFLVATEEHARRIDLAMEQGIIEMAILQLPTLRYQVVVIPSHETAGNTGHGYAAKVSRSSQAPEEMVQVVDLRADLQ